MTLICLGDASARLLDTSLAAGSGEAFQQFRGRFVVGDLGDEFTSEGFGEQCWSEAIGCGAGGGEASFEAIGEGK